MKKILLVLLLAFTLEHAPFRLAAVSVQALVMPSGYTRLDMNGTDRYWQTLDLDLRLTKLGWKVSYEKNLLEQHSAYGMTSFRDRTIQIDERLNWNARFAVLAHEGGHTLQPTYSMSLGQAEVFAESVAMLVEGRGQTRHARYLAMWRPDLITALVYWQEIYKAAGLLRP